MRAVIGVASMNMPTVIGAMMNTRIFIDVVIILRLSSLLPEAAARDIYGNSRFVQTNVNTPAMIVYRRFA